MKCIGVTPCLGNSNGGLKMNTWKLRFSLSYPTQMQAGEGASTAISQLEQEKVNMPPHIGLQYWLLAISAQNISISYWQCYKMNVGN